MRGRSQRTGARRHGPGSVTASVWRVVGIGTATATVLAAETAALWRGAGAPGVIDTDMLRSCFGGTASRYPAPAKWAEKAVPFILSLNSRDSGKPLTVE